MEAPILDSNIPMVQIVELQGRSIFWILPGLWIVSSVLGSGRCWGLGRQKIKHLIAVKEENQSLRQETPELISSNDVGCSQRVHV